MKTITCITGKWFLSFFLEFSLFEVERWRSCARQKNKLKMEWREVYHTRQVHENKQCVMNNRRKSRLFVCVMRGGSSSCCPSPGSPVSGMPCARCILEHRTSLAETKKILPGASSRPTTFSSSARKLTQRSRCCFLTWTAGGGVCSFSFFSSLLRFYLWLFCCRGKKKTN